ncbi:MAG: EF-hand domain-containing protein [Candidatus Thalassarchaeaceae archaeon]|nr:EF-hand domain-containing protein [Candidatus Thalassarchaeaceae archaeon]
MLNDQFISIAIKNLQDVLARKGISPEALFSKYDFDNNDSLDYGEFSNALESVTGQKAPPMVLKAIFSAIDGDGNGNLDLQEILSVFNGQIVEDSQDISDAGSLILAGHPDETYNGDYLKQNSLINGQKWFKNSKNKRSPRILYYYDKNSGGTTSWSLDDREQDGSKDLYRGGWTRSTGDGILPLGTLRWVGIGKLTFSISYDTSTEDSADAASYVGESIQEIIEEDKLKMANLQTEELKQNIYDQKTGKEQLNYLIENKDRPSDISGLMVELNQVRNALTKGIDDGSVNIKEGRSMADLIFEKQSSNLPTPLRIIAKKSWNTQADAFEKELLIASTAVAGVAVAGIAASKLTNNNLDKKIVDKSSNIKEINDDSSEPNVSNMESTKVSKVIIKQSEVINANYDTEIPLNYVSIKEIFSDFNDVNFSSEIANIESKYRGNNINLEFKIIEIQRTCGIGIDEKYRGGYSLIANHIDGEVEIKLNNEISLDYYKINSKYDISASVNGWNRIRKRLILES